MESLAIALEDLIDDSVMALPQQPATPKRRARKRPATPAAVELPEDEQILLTAPPAAGD